MADETLVCDACGLTVPDDAKFCVECGHDLNSNNEKAASDTESPQLQTMSGIHTVPLDGKVGEHSDDRAEEVRLSAGEDIAGKFRIEGIIGQGGMGTVYRATEILSNKSAAVKVISPRYVASDKAVQRLIEEGTTTRDISHTNIVRVYDIGLHNRQPYIAMEYIDGEPLHVWRSRKMAADEYVPAAVAAQIIKEILNGLEVAHEEGIIHRDLKPENIMLIGEPTAKKAHVKIVDFGIALATKTLTQTGTGTGLGTQLYMAPEQIRNANAANASADLYSVSKIFYELIVGVLPTGHWQPPSLGRSDVPVGIDKLIESGLAQNRKMRPQSAEEYRDKLIRAMNGGAENVDQKTPAKKNWVLPAVFCGLGLFGLIFLIAIIEALVEPGPGPDTETGVYDYYVGNWNDSFGGSYGIDVSDDGSLYGAGRYGDGTPVEISGTLTKTGVNFTFEQFGSVTARGSGTLIDACHINFTATRLSDNASTSGQFHVNHSAGQPCP